MTYATTDQVRQSAWFEGNLNVTDSYIDDAREEAYGVVNGYVGLRYVMPLTWLSGESNNLLRHIERLYASGRILLDEYGFEGRDADKNGEKRLGEAKELLDAISKGETKLTNAEGEEMPRNNGVSSTNTSYSDMRYGKRPQEQQEGAFSLSMKL